MSNERLQEAIRLVRAGQNAAARQILLEYIQQNPQDISAWMWLAQTLPNDTQRVAVLQECLKRNPGNATVQQTLELLRSRLTPTPPPASPSSPRPLQPVRPAPVAQQPPPPPPPTPAAAPPTAAIFTADYEEQPAPPPAQTQPAKKRRRLRFWLGTTLAVLLLLVTALAAVLLQPWYRPGLIALLTPAPSGTPTSAQAQSEPTHDASTAYNTTSTPPPAPTATPTLAPLPPDLPDHLGQGSITAIAYSRDGQVLLVVSGAGLYRYDAATRKLLDSSDTPQPLAAIQPQPDGSVLAASLERQPDAQQLKIWKIYNRRVELLHNIALPGYQVECLTFSPQGDILATGGAGQEESSAVRLWNLADGSLIRTLSGGTQWGILKLAFSPDGRSLVGADAQGSLGFWHVADGQSYAITAGHRTRSVGSRVNSLIFTPDGKALLSTGQDRAMRLWDVQNGKLLRTYTGHTSGVQQAVFTPDGQKIISIAEGEMRFWRINRVDPVSARKDIPALRLALSPDGGQLAAAVDDVVNLYHAGDMQALGKIDGFMSPISAVAFSANGQWLAAGGTGKVYLWRIQPVSLERTFQTQGKVLSLAFSPNGAMLAAGEVSDEGKGEGVTQVWRLPDGALQHNLKRMGKLTLSVFGLAFSPDSTLLAAGTRRGTELWRKDGVLIQIYPVSREQQDRVQVAFAPDGNALAIALSQGVLLYQSPGSGAVLETLSGSGQALAVTQPDAAAQTLILYSADSQHIYRGSGAKKQDTVPLEQIAGQIPMDGAVFSPTQKLLAAGGGRCVPIWRVKDGKALACLPGHHLPVSGVTFSPTGLLLASGSSDGTIRFWSLQGME